MAVIEFNSLLTRDDLVWITLGPFESSQAAFDAVRHYRGVVIKIVDRWEGVLHAKVLA